MLSLHKKRVTPQAKNGLWTYVDSIALRSDCADDSLALRSDHANAQGKLELHCQHVSESPFFVDWSHIYLGLKRNTILT